MRIKVYIGIILALAAFLVYAVFFMQEGLIVEEVTSDAIILTEDVETKEQPKVIESEYIPHVVPYGVIAASRENDFYWYLFDRKGFNVIFYTYTPGSTDPADSESFHQEIDKYLHKTLYQGLYHNDYLIYNEMKKYEKSMLKTFDVINFVADENTPKKIITSMEIRKSELFELLAFIEGCAKTFCIINAEKEEYVKLETRDLESAKKLLKDYLQWGLAD